jgi:endonuclease VIII
MPEGDTIFRAARALNKALAGRRVVAFETALAKIARVNDDTPLVARTVERVESRGKWCLIFFSAPPEHPSPENELILVTHMLMSGSWHLYRTGERWRMPHRAMRVMLRVGPRDGDAGWEAVAFNVPVVEFHTARSLERSSQVPRLGPDILDAAFTHDTGTTRLTQYAHERPEAEVGVTLLNQRVLAGLGNVYKSEVAFSAHVNPWRTLATLTPTEIDRLIDFSLRYMKANVQDGSGDGIVTYTGNRRTTQRMDREERLWVYGRQGEECRRCGATIMMRKQGTQARSTYWCPECQPWLGEGAAPVGGTFKGVGRRRASC